MLAERAPSLSVLYLQNVTPDTSAAALAEGITEELIVRLSQVAGLRVTSRYGAARYRNRVTVDPRRVGRELGVRYVLQGSLRRAGDLVRVSVEITDAVGGHNVWAMTFERPVGAVFALQDSVAVQVAQAVRGRLTGRERARLAPQGPTRNTVAYEAYLRGRAAIRGRTAAAGAQAVAEYRRALALDSGFAAAVAGLAHAYALAADWGWELAGLPSDSVATLAVRTAARALALDSASADAWLAAAMAWRLREPRRALRDHRRAVALDSNHIEALHQLAWGYFGVGELDSAIAVERRVTQRDPFYAYPYAGLTNMLNVAGRPLEALAAASQGMAFDSTLGWLHDETADLHLRLGRPALARAAAARAMALGAPPYGPRVLSALARREEGDSTSARAEVAEVAGELRAVLARSPSGLTFEQAGFLSGAYAQLAEGDSAIAWARRLSPVEQRLNAVIFAHHWLWAPLRADPRFQRFLDEVRPRGTP